MPKMHSSLAKCYYNSGPSMDGVKDLLNIFPSCVIIFFISVYKERDPETEEVFW